MPSRTERLTLALTDFQVDAEAAGGRGKWSGYANTFGYLDANYGGINVPGCFTQSIPEFLVNGFVPDSHGAAEGFEYTILGTYGYPTLCREDERGLYFEGEFHGDAESQIVRQRMQERAQAGKSVGMSIGWVTEQSFRIFPKDYATQLPKYLADEFKADGLAEAQNWPSILIRQQCNLIECSLTLTPANTASLVTEVQSMKIDTQAGPSTLREALGQYLDVDKPIAFAQLNVLINALFYDVAYTVFCDPIHAPENRAVWAGALAEFSDYCLAIYDAFVAAESAEGQEPVADEDGNAVSAEEQPMMAARYLRQNFVNPEHLTLPGLTGTKQLADFALSTVRRLLTRESSLAERRVQKERLGRLSGKVVSKPNHDALSELCKLMEEAVKTHTSDMKTHINALKEFLAKFDPNGDDKPTEKQDADTNSDHSRTAKLRAIQLKQLAAKSIVS